MRENLFHGKRKDNGEWVEGYYCAFNDVSHRIYTGYAETDCGEFYPDYYEVIPGTVGQYAESPDKNGKMIFEGDIVKYSTFDGFDCRSIVKFGRYKQDGSGGEYKASDCLGFYVEVDKFTCPDWCDDSLEAFHDYRKQQSLAEIVSQCEIIGNIYENPELVRNEV